MQPIDPLRLGYVAGQDVTLDRLQDQLEWYDKNSGKNQRTFKGLKIATMLAAALVPVFASKATLTGVAAALGVLIVIFEGLQHLYQYQANWIAYRSTCEALKHEKFLYLAMAGPYAAVGDAHALLAERIESTVSQEHAKWASSREHTGKSQTAVKQP